MNSRSNSPPSDRPAAGNQPAPMAPGDQAPEGTPGSGETVCPRCGGNGRSGSGICPECQGRGKVIVGVGGG